MFGFIVGALSLIALLKVARGYRRGYRCAGGYGYGYGWHGGWGRHHHHHHRHWSDRSEPSGQGGWRRFALYSLFEKLDATPGQEKVIAAAMDELRGKLRKARETWHQSKGDIANAIRGEQLTEEQTQNLTAPYASLFDEMRDAAGDAMRKIHDALDSRQRQILADIIDSGAGWHRY